MEALAGYITTNEAASRLGVTRFRVQQLIQSNKLDSVKLGRIRLVTEESVQNSLDNTPKNGRPRKK